MKYIVEAFFGFCSRCGPAANSGELVINEFNCPVCGGQLTEQIASSETINNFICDDGFRPMFEPDGEVADMSLHTITLYSLELRDHIGRPYPQQMIDRMKQRLDELSREISRRSGSL